MTFSNIFKELLPWLFCDSIFLRATNCKTQYQSNNEYLSQPEVVKNGKVPIRDPDDSWTHDKMQHKIIWMNRKSEYLSEEEIKLEFQTFNSKMVSTKLEPYIQMGGHGALISPENNVFIHFHLL